jgi:hypothetical protein
MNINYDEISPITGNKCVLVEADETTNIESRICMESGYTTNERLKIDSDDITRYESTITEFMCTMKYVDEELGCIWYPTFINLPNGMVYCEPKDDKLVWKTANVIEISEVERLKYPIPNKEGEYFTSRLDVENAKTYDKYDFKSALDELYSIVLEVNNED